MKCVPKGSKICIDFKVKKSHIYLPVSVVCRIYVLPGIAKVIELFQNYYFILIMCYWSLDMCNSKKLHVC